MEALEGASVVRRCGRHDSRSRTERPVKGAAHLTVTFSPQAFPACFLSLLSLSLPASRQLRCPLRRLLWLLLLLLPPPPPPARPPSLSFSSSPSLLSLTLRLAQLPLSLLSPALSPPSKRRLAAARAWAPPSTPSHWLRALDLRYR